MSKIKKFSFYINYMDVDFYLFWIIDKYKFDDNSKFVKLIDNDFTSRIDNPHEDADELLFAIRKCLIQNGFSKEVEACDYAFQTERKSRNSANQYTPLSKRM